MHRPRVLGLIISSFGMAMAALVMVVYAPQPPAATAAGRASQFNYLPLVMKNYGCASGTLIQDGGFEASMSGTTNPYWKITSNIPRSIFDNSSIPQPNPTHSGIWKAWLGGDNALSQTLTQTLSVPSGATSLQASVWWLVNTTEPNPSGLDHMEMEILDGSGSLQETLYHFKDVDQGSSWAQKIITATQAYAGQTIQLAFAASTDPTNVTSFFIDDVNVVCK